MLGSRVLLYQVIQERIPESDRCPAEESASQEGRTSGEMPAKCYEKREQREREAQDMRGKSHAATEREIQVDRAIKERDAEDYVLDPRAARESIGPHLLKEEEEEWQIQGREYGG